MTPFKNEIVVQWFHISLMVSSALTLHGELLENITLATKRPYRHLY